MIFRQVLGTSKYDGGDATSKGSGTLPNTSMCCDDVVDYAASDAENDLAKTPASYECQNSE